jgi:hypothetical protein
MRVGQVWARARVRQGPAVVEIWQFEPFGTPAIPRSEEPANPL